MKHGLLQHGQLPQSLESKLAERHDVHRLRTESGPEGFLACHGSEFVALATVATIGADKALMAADP